MVVRPSTVHAAEEEWRGLLNDEVEIEWIPGFDPRRTRYVRQAMRELEPSPRGKPRCARYPNGCRVVGWANQKRRPANMGVPGLFKRRIFYLKRHDPYPDGGLPLEAVDPLTVRLGCRVS